MDQTIRKYLEELESSKGIKILLACETGSRAWGFPSPDSDYDVRILYKHKLDWYISLGSPRDTIEQMLDDNEIDISGWELRKSLNLMMKSNAPLIERVQSPIIYKADEKFLPEYIKLVKNCYSRIATMHHYLSIAQKCYTEITEGKTYKLKRFFYGLRTATVCEWILVHEEIPPIEFSKVLEGIEVPQPIQNKIKDLVELKATKSENYLHIGEEDVIAYMKSCIDQAKEQITLLPSAAFNKGAIDEFLKEQIL
ncbi:MAG: nucleotidyltransferase domain-containing protein [Lentisphaeria bacterium]|nr:nucleotidyltransferase domain-containing protein [Lentisphaeria bacterium]